MLINMSKSCKYRLILSITENCENCQTIWFFTVTF